ncbi:DUF3429 domain-containing protein [Sphingomonas sp.]|uniref:DUF3429 domain-containing protein n=1 Tax=Sphingomonas sp. TaxID=28214 RepID=UPI002C6FE5B0|nr:DUF3429 domain-containing protein [Sphingomonas sp.]HTG37375.1 DUF3429 domain-containing protein [Sphingomonas sp.]
MVTKDRSVPLATTVPPLVRMLGFAGLLPQIAAVAVPLVAPSFGFAAQALGFAYASLILSFLGGLWWGLAAAGHERAPGWLYGAAVVPSLFALACAVPWAVGWPWPGPSLIALALAIWASLWIDFRLARKGLTPGWWLSLRVPLSAGLGLLTLIVGLMA